jgi:hypothetical protein
MGIPESREHAAQHLLDESILPDSHVPPAFDGFVQPTEWSRESSHWDGLLIELSMQPLISYVRHRFPPDVIRHAVWLYLRFTLSYRDVDDLLAERGIEVSNESIRRWVLRFGPGMRETCVRPDPGLTIDGTSTRW